MIVSPSFNLKKSLSDLDLATHGSQSHIGHHPATGVRMRRSSFAVIHLITISLVSHKLLPRISITNSVPSPDDGSIRRDFCTVQLIFMTELLGPTPTPLRRPVHLQQVPTALIIITSHYEFR